MLFLPFQILGIWFRGLLALAILAGGIYLLKLWSDDSQITEVVIPADDRVNPEQRRDQALEAATNGRSRRVFRYEPGWNRGTALLSGGMALLAWATLGRWIGQGLFRMTLRSGKPGPRTSNPASSGQSKESKRARREKARRQKATAAPSTPVTEADDDPQTDRTGEVHTIRRPDGSEIRVECYGPAQAPPIIWTHGWGANSTEWFYQKQHLAGRFRLILWDEPGLGLSKKPGNNDFRLEKYAADLAAVIEFSGDRPVVLVGHSIGGMIILTLCKAFPGVVSQRVAGLVLAHTTYKNPVRTTQMASLYTALEKPVLIPLMYLMIATWPLAWFLNWMSYVNGSAQRSTHKSSFAGTETRGQLDFVAAFMPHARPDVLARGMLGMIAYDATATLATIPVPTLVVVGDKDTTTLPEAGHFIAQNVPKGTLSTLSPARHMGLIEHHEKFDQLVADFARRCQPSPVGR